MNERQKYIETSLRNHYKEAIGLGGEVFCVVLQGSQNYNLDIYTDEYKSDIDTKAIVLPSFEDFCKGKQPTSTTRVRENNEHIDLKDIRIMFDTLKKQNVNFVEILFSPYFIVPPKYEKFWQDLRNIGEELTHCHPAQTLRTMAGQSYEKRKAICHRYPTLIEKIDKYGYDGKQLHHILRINSFMKNYIAGMSFAECLVTRTDEELQRMQDAKLSKFSLEDALSLADKYNDENRKIKDEYIEKYGEVVDVAPYRKIDELKTSILKNWFREQLTME